MEFCADCLKIVNDNLSQSDLFTLNIISENEIINKEDIIGLVKVFSRQQDKNVIRTKSGITSILNKLEGAALIKIKIVGRQKLYSVNQNGQKVLEGVEVNEN